MLGAPGKRRCPDTHVCAETCSHPLAPDLSVWGECGGNELSPTPPWGLWMACHCVLITHTMSLWPTRLAGVFLPSGWEQRAEGSSEWH